MSPKLPIEIWIRIFLQLHQDDRVECMLVCHDWNRTIERFVQYQTVFINTLEIMKKLIEKIQQKPDIANRIEKLMVNIAYGQEVYSRVDYDKLLHLLTNLKVLYSSTNSLSNDGDNNRNKEYPWRTKIEYVSETAGDATGHYLTSSNTYPKLKTLRLGTHNFDSFSIFKNTPSLTSLSITACAMFDFDRLEMIHEALPHLKSLRLPILFKSGSFEFDHNISPATSMTTCEFAFSETDEYYDDVHEFNNTIQLLEYIKIKYPNLTKLKYKIDIGLVSDDDDLQNLKDIGWIPLFRKLGSQLKGLYLAVEDCYDHLFDILDNSSCRLRSIGLQWLTCTILEKLVSSQQASYIETLLLENAECGSFHWLQDLQVLKRLKLFDCMYDDSVKDIQISAILDNIPSTLESLTLEELDLVIDHDYTGTSNIKTLSFKYTTLHDKSDDFISKCFPNVSTLTLECCKLLGKTFNLAKMDLLTLYYDEYDYKHIPRCKIAVVTLENNERRIYNYNADTRQLVSSTSRPAFFPQHYLPYRSHLEAEVKNTKCDLVFICNSLGSLVLLE